MAGDGGGADAGVPGGVRKGVRHLLHHGGVVHGAGDAGGGRGENGQEVQVLEDEGSWKEAEFQEEQSPMNSFPVN